MKEEILSRQILMALGFCHLLIAYLGATVKANVPAKAFKAFFVTEFLLITGYIIYTCITEPFYNGIGIGIIGYIVFYLSLEFSYICLRHWIIVPNKIYEFSPKEVKEWDTGERAVGGYITESGYRFHVYVDDEAYCDIAKTSIPVKIRYREWKNFAAHFELVDTQV